MRKLKKNIWKKRFIFIILLIFFWVCVIFTSSYHSTKRWQRRKLNRNTSYLSALVPLEQKVPNENLVLIWTKYFGGDLLSDSSDLFSTLNKTYPGCFDNCQMTSDRRYLKVSDAIVFHSRDLRKDDLPPLRANSQLYIYLQQESPSYTKVDLKKYENVFNWTMTYRRDSDVYHPYFNLKETGSEEVSIGSHNFLKEKTKLVAWIVSNCYTPGQREVYVEELSEFIPIDVYGECGSFPCEKDCLSKISRQYKFFLAFENSLCVDYITEKFSNALENDLVPVAYGGGDYDLVAPRGSFINTKDFRSPKDLADYLKYLDKNDEAYLKYFKWKEKFKVQIGGGWCNLCKALGEWKRNPRKMEYKSLLGWWNFKNRSKIKIKTSHKNGELKSSPFYKGSKVEVEAYASACHKSDIFFNGASRSFQQQLSSSVKKIGKWLRRKMAFPEE